jgi:two-component system LytT family response regulator
MTVTAVITTLVVEDEPLARRRLVTELIRDTSWLHCLGEAANGRAAIGAIDELRPDLVFLDIRLPDISGIDLLSRVRHLPAVVFTTAHDQFAVAAFERERFTRALERARPLLERQAAASTAERAREVLSQGALSRLFVREADRIVPIHMAAIEWLQACDDYVIVHYGSRQSRINLTLSDLERRLDPDLFLRIHRSHIVNLDHVASWTPYDGSRYQITLRSGTKLLASRQRSQLLRTLCR